MFVCSMTELGSAERLSVPHLTHSLCVSVCVCLCVFQGLQASEAQQMFGELLPAMAQLALRAPRLLTQVQDLSETCFTSSDAI